MATAVAAGIPLSGNDISSLAQLIETILQYYCIHSSPLQKDYMKKLNTLMGLGFTAVLANGSLIAVHKPRLKIFIDYCHHNKIHSGVLSAWSFAIGEMINEAVRALSFLNYPAYYKDFLVAVEGYINQVIVTCKGKMKGEINRLLYILCKKEE